MKKFFSSLSLAMGIFALSTQVFAIQVTLPLTHAYIPLGNDSNDRPEIVLEGYLPNLCYEMGEPEYLLSGKEILISMTGIYHPEHEPFCLQTAYYFESVIKLDRLEQGDYLVKLLNQEKDDIKRPFLAQEFAGELRIEQPKAKTIDDYLYANVYEIHKTSNKNQVIISGMHPENCLGLKKIEFISNGTDSVSVLPIMEQITTTCFEPVKKVPFEYTITLPAEPKRSKILVHVRTARGQSVNKIIRR